MIKQLENTKARFLKELVESTWDITQHYWYPLYDCKRSDVLAFNYDYIKGDAEKINDVRKILRALNYDSIYEMDEVRTVFLIETNAHVPSLAVNVERFWFSEDMSWIIYISHEGSITFGGEKLVNQVKSKWRNWKSNIFVIEYDPNDDV